MFLVLFLPLLVAEHSQWIIVLNGSGTVLGEPKDQVMLTQSELLKKMMLMNIHFEKVSEITGISSMLSVSLFNISDVGRIHALPSVRRVYPDEIIQNHNLVGKNHHFSSHSKKDFNPRMKMWHTYKPKNREKLYDSFERIHNLNISRLLPHGLTGVEKAHEYGITGKNVKIGIFDSGIDGRHPAFGGRCYLDGNNCPIVKWRDFVKNTYGMLYDCPFIGHGTKVAGICCGKNSSFVGVAPDSKLYIYKVYDCNGKIRAWHILAALDEAVERDRVNVINLSFGRADPWRLAPITLAVEDISKGAPNVVFVSAAGNEPLGLFSISGPGSSQNVISAASLESKYVLTRKMEVETINGPVKIDFLFSVRNPITSKDISDTLIVLNLFPEESLKFTNRLCVKEEKYSEYDCQGNLKPKGCPDFVKYMRESLIKGATVLMYQGRCTVNDMHEAIILFHNYETKSVILAYENDNLGHLGTRLTVKSSLKWAKITAKDAQVFPIKSGIYYTPKLIIHEVDELKLNSEYTQISSFSSYGPTANFEMKPDISAFGTSVFTTTTMRKGGWTFDDGTSFSSAYVTGCVALLIQKFGPKHHELIKQDLISSGIPSMSRVKGYALPVFGQGGGLINVWKALQKTTQIRPSTLKFTEESTHMINSISLINTLNQSVQYQFTHLPSLSILDYTLLDACNISLIFEQQNFTIPPLEEMKCNFQISVPQNLTKPTYYSGYIAVTAESEGKYYVPYTGIHGSEKLSELARDLKTIVHYGSNIGQELHDGDIAYFTNGSKIEITYELLQPVRQAVLFVYKVAEGREYVGRLNYQKDISPRKVIVEWRYFMPDIYDIPDGLELIPNRLAVPGWYHVVLAIQQNNRPPNYNDLNENSAVVFGPLIELL